MRRTITDLGMNLLNFFRRYFTKKRIIFLCFFSVSLFMNIIPLFVFEDKIAITKVSYFAIFIMAIITFIGILAYIFRRNANLLFLGGQKGNYWEETQPEAREKGYHKKFFVEFIIFWSAIPFYIPCIFFSYKISHTLWSILLLTAPQLIMGAYEYITLSKEARIAVSQKEKELKEQQQREELGRYR